MELVFTRQYFNCYYNDNITNISFRASKVDGLLGAHAALEFVDTVASVYTDLISAWVWEWCTIHIISYFNRKMSCKPRKEDRMESSKTVTQNMELRSLYQLFSLSLTSLTLRLYRAAWRGKWWLIQSVRKWMVRLWATAVTIAGLVISLSEPMEELTFPREACQSNWLERKTFVDSAMKRTHWCSTLPSFSWDDIKQTFHFIQNCFLKVKCITFSMVKG